VTAGVLVAVTEGVGVTVFVGVFEGVCVGVEVNVRVGVGVIRIGTMSSQSALSIILIVKSDVA
jgi:hypothetical protein